MDGIPRIEHDIRLEMLINASHVCPYALDPEPLVEHWKPCLYTTLLQDQVNGGISKINKQRQRPKALRGAELVMVHICYSETAGVYRLSSQVFGDYDYDMTCYHCYCCFGGASRHG